MATPELIRALSKDGAFPFDAGKKAMEWILEPPSKSSWLGFLSWSLTILGAGLVLAGTVFFFAFNWQDMGKFLKFGLIEALIIAVVILAYILGDGVPRKAAVTAAVILVGPLLAVYGQTYQTGADPFELFVGWGLLVLPWVFASQFAATWLVWLAIVETGFFLAWEQVLEHAIDIHTPVLPILTISSINILFWIIKELLCLRGVKWMRSQWPARFIAFATYLGMVICIIMIIVGESPIKGRPSVTFTNSVAIFMGAGLTAATLFYYRSRQKDLFMLTLALGATMCVVTVFLGNFLIDELDAELFGFFFLGFAVIGQVAFIVWWIRDQSKRIELSESGEEEDLP